MAVIVALIETCKLIGINPNTLLAAMLIGLGNCHPLSRINELLSHAHAGSEHHLA